MVLTTPFLSNNSFCKLYLGGSGTSFSDVSTGGKAVTRVGDTTWSSGALLFGKNTIYFDGSGDYLTLADSADFAISRTGIFSFWYKPSSDATSQTIFSHYQSDTIRMRATVITSGTRELQFYIRDSTGTIINLATSAGNLTAGSFYHIAISINGLEVKIYVDGLLRGSGTMARAFPDIAGTFRIGADYFSGATRDLAYGYLGGCMTHKWCSPLTRNFTAPTRLA